MITQAAYFTYFPSGIVGGNGGFDDRFRFRPSGLSAYTSTQIRRYPTWPDDARDFGLRDSLADNTSRLI